MTNKEAKRILQFCIPMKTDKQREAIKLAIKALEQLEERPQGDLISRSELKKALHNFFDGKVTDEPAYILRDVFCHIDNAPTVEQKYYERVIAQINPVIEAIPKGEWIKWNFKTFGAMGDWEYKCSNCEKVYGGEYNFCPNCGARMQKGGEENDT